MKKVDLHIHSCYSDGTQTPDAIFKMAKKNNCTVISITDHDFVKDYTEISAKYGVRTITGIEFNTAVHNMHILGYGISDIDLVNKEMKLLRLKNEKVCLKIIKLMQAKGYDISEGKILKFLEDINLCSDIIDKRKIVKYLIDKGYAVDVLDAYNKLIGVNTEFYIPNYKISPFEVIDLIKNGGGKAILAHPNTIDWNSKNIYEEIQRLKNNGLFGIEIINTKMNMKDNIYTEIADNMNLLKTVGSDFHDMKTDNLGVSVSDDYLDNLSKKLLLNK